MQCDRSVKLIGHQGESGRDAGPKAERRQGEAMTTPPKSSSWPRVLTDYGHAAIIGVAVVYGVIVAIWKDAKR